MKSNETRSAISPLTESRAYETFCKLKWCKVKKELHLIHLANGCTK